VEAGEATERKGISRTFDGAATGLSDAWSESALEGLVFRALPSRDFFRGPDVGLREPETSKTALHMAAEAGSSAAVAALLQAGADPESRDAWGRRPVDFARSSRVQNMLEGALRARDEARRNVALGGDRPGNTGTHRANIPPLGSGVAPRTRSRHNGSSSRPRSGVGVGSGTGSGTESGFA